MSRRFLPADQLAPPATAGAASPSHHLLGAAAGKLQEDGWFNKMATNEVKYAPICEAIKRNSGTTVTVAKCQGRLNYLRNKCTTLFCGCEAAELQVPH